MHRLEFVKTGNTFSVSKVKSFYLDLCLNNFKAKQVTLYEIVV